MMTAPQTARVEMRPSIRDLKEPLAGTLSHSLALGTGISSVRIIADRVITVYVQARFMKTILDKINKVY